MEDTKPGHSTYGLPFISDVQFEYHVGTTLAAMRRYVDYRDFTHPVVDPVKWAFMCQLRGLNNSEAIGAEVQRQVEKSNNNIIGYFHQNIFRYSPAGWIVPEAGKGGGFDLINPRRHLYVEIKNGTQHNSSEQAGLWLRMKRMVDLDPKAKCYLVEVLTPKSGERPFYFAPDSRVRGGLGALLAEEKNIAEAVCEMGDLLDDFDDDEWHGGNFRDSYEERNVGLDDDCYMAPFSMLSGIRKIDPATLPTAERNYYERIRRASMDWLYGKVWGKRRYFFDMLEQLPLAVWNVADEGQYKRSEPAETVEWVLRRKGLELDNDMRPADHVAGKECFRAYKELYRHWLGVCYKELGGKKG